MAIMPLYHKTDKSIAPVIYTASKNTDNKTKDFVK